MWCGNQVEDLILVHENHLKETETDKPLVWRLKYIPPTPTKRMETGKSINVERSIKNGMTKHMH